MLSKVGNKTHRFFSAKYPYLQLQNPAEKEEKQQGGSVLHFGSVAVGKTLQKHFVISNPLPVSTTKRRTDAYVHSEIHFPLILSYFFFQVAASFSLARMPGRLPLFGSEFRCDISRGKVAPGGSLRATVTFSPAVVDTVSVEYLSVKCRGALNETILKLMGSCTGKGPTEKQRHLQLQFKGINQIQHKQIHIFYITGFNIR